MPRSDPRAPVIALLEASGWKADGATNVEVARVPTANSPLLGRSGGELRSFGGRLRFALPNTDRKVTVGARTTCFYKVRDGMTYGEKTLNTSQLREIEQAIGPAPVSAEMESTDPSLG